MEFSTAQIFKLQTICTFRILGLCIQLITCYQNISKVSGLRDFILNAPMFMSFF